MVLEERIGEIMERKAKKIVKGAVFAAVLIFMIWSGIFDVVKKAVTESGNIPELWIGLSGNTIDEINNGSKFTEYTGITVSGANIRTEITATIRGRGNSTWKGVKKPYQLEFDGSVDLLGLGSSSKWVLLSNEYDRTLLRNDITFNLARDMGERFSPMGKHIDLYVDGEYQGNYYILPKISLDKSSVDLRGNDAVLMEIDCYIKDGSDLQNDAGTNDMEETHSDEPFFVSEIYGTKIALKDSNMKAAAMENVKSFAEAYNCFERDASTGNWEAVKNDINIGSFVDYYLLSEYAENIDSTCTSFYLYRGGRDEKIAAGPVWDHDSAYGNSTVGPTNLYNNPRKLWVYNANYTDDREWVNDTHILTDLMDMPGFRAEVERKYKEVFQYAIDKEIEALPKKAGELRKSAEKDQKLLFEKYNSILESAAVGKDDIVFEDYNEELESLMKKLKQRKVLMDKVFLTRVTPEDGEYVLDLGYAKNFKLTQLHNGFFVIEDVVTGKALTGVEYEKRDYGDALVTEEVWNGSEEQQWMFFDAGNGKVNLMLKYNNLFLSNGKEDGLVLSSYDIKETGVEMFSLGKIER